MTPPRPEAVEPRRLKDTKICQTQESANTGFSVCRFPLWSIWPSSPCVGAFVLKRALLAIALMSTIRSARADSNLLENSPFLPTSQAAAAAQQPAPLELRSIVKEGGQYEFSLYDSAKKRSTWIRLNEPGNDFLVKAFDPANNAITVEQHSLTYTLTLKEARIALSANYPMTPAGGFNPSNPDGGKGQQVAENRLTPQEIRDLERLRALKRQREARLLQQNQTGQPTSEDD